MPVSQILINWYHQHKRDLPWRNTRDPFRIWLSEIILQQTRVEQGLPYYIRFTEQFPHVTALADASEDEVLKLWQGLGYYSRARNLHAAARQIRDEYQSVFPGSYAEIIKLKGIGEYTAAAISSFAYNEVQAVVDGNVFRVLARYYGIDTPINSTQGKKIFTQIANEIIDPLQPAMHNQAIMEFGAIQCKPQNPDCSICPLREGCVAFRENKVSQLPVKIRNTKIRKRYLNYFLIKENAGLYIRKRTDNDIWKNMYEFPLIETPSQLSEQELMQGDEWQKLFGNKKYSIRSISHEIKHVLSHQHLYARFWKVDLAGKYPDLSEQFVFVKDEELMNFALPRLIDSFLEKFA